MAVPTPIKASYNRFQCSAPIGPFEFTCVLALTIPRRAFSPAPVSFADINELESRKMMGLLFATVVAANKFSVRAQVYIETVMRNGSTTEAFAYTFWAFFEDDKFKAIMPAIFEQNERDRYSLPGPANVSAYTSRVRNVGREYQNISDVRSLKAAVLTHSNFIVVRHIDHNNPHALSDDVMDLQTAFMAALAINMRPPGACDPRQDSNRTYFTEDGMFEFPRPQFVYTMLDIYTTPASALLHMLPDVQLLQHPPSGGNMIDAKDLFGGQHTEFLANNQTHFDATDRQKFHMRDASPMDPDRQITIPDTIAELRRMSFARINQIKKIQGGVVEAIAAPEIAARLLYIHHSRLVASQIFAGFRGKNASPFYKTAFDLEDTQYLPTWHIPARSTSEFVDREIDRWETYINTYFVAPTHMANVLMIALGGHAASDSMSMDNVTLMIILRSLRGTYGKSYICNLGASAQTTYEPGSTTSRITACAFSGVGNKEGETIVMEDIAPGMLGIRGDGPATAELDERAQKFKQLATNPMISTRGLLINKETGEREDTTSTSLQLKVWAMNSNEPILLCRIPHASRTRYAIPALDESARPIRSRDCAEARESRRRTEDGMLDALRATAQLQFYWESTCVIEMHRAISARAIEPVTLAGSRILWDYLHGRAVSAGYPARDCRDRWRFMLFTTAACMRAVARNTILVTPEPAPSRKRSRGDESTSASASAEREAGPPRRFDARSIIEPNIDRKLVNFSEHAIYALGIAPWLLINPIERDVRTALLYTFHAGHHQVGFRKITGEAGTPVVIDYSYISFTFPRRGRNEDAERLIPLADTLSSMISTLPGWEIQPCSDAIARMLADHSEPRELHTWYSTINVTGKQDREVFKHLATAGTSKRCPIEAQTKEYITTLHVHLDLLHPSKIPPPAKMEIAGWLHDFFSYRHQGGFSAFFGAVPWIGESDDQKPWILNFPRASLSAEPFKHGEEELHCDLDCYAASTRAAGNFTTLSPMPVWKPLEGIALRGTEFTQPHFVGVPITTSSNDSMQQITKFAAEAVAPDAVDAEYSAADARISANVYAWDCLSDEFQTDSLEEFRASSKFGKFKPLFLRKPADESPGWNARHAKNLAKFKIVAATPHIRNTIRGQRLQMRGATCDTTYEMTKARVTKLDTEITSAK